MSDLPSDSALESTGADDDITWESFEPDVYQKTAEALVHHSFKSINSNVPAGGVRLSSRWGVDLPYVGVRPLLARGISLDLDYTANSGKTAKVVKQIRAVARGGALASKAPPAQANVIRCALSKASTSDFSVGTESVDARMRQVLLPRDDGSYVAYTPVTASGLCSLLFDRESGLVPTHNAKVAEEAKAVPHGGDGARQIPRWRRIARAQLGIGGSNPQNVGSLVRAMQRPLFVPGPGGNHSLRTAFRIYYRGIELPLPRHLVIEYRNLRSALHDGSGRGTRMEARKAEESWAHRLAMYVLTLGADALETLRAFEDALPQEHVLQDADGAYELVSRSVKPWMRGLIDSRLRGGDWPQLMADAVIGRLKRETHNVEGKPVSSVPLDTAAEAKLASLLEEAFR